MKNTQLYPFERNNYYYGMLLSVENFNAEQKYLNDKRRLINRLVHGSGVVSGMNVVAIDEQTISLESGLAFDSTGREIVVANPVTKKLSMINGYDSAMSSGCNAYVYLCIEYNENEKGQMLDISSGNNDKAHDRVREGYELYLTSAEPEDDIDSIKAMYEHSTTVFSNESLRIRHVMPRYVNPLSVFEFRVEIESFTKQFVSFSYGLQLICLTCEDDDSSVLTVKFNEMLVEKTGKYVLTYRLKVNNVVDTEASASIDPSTFTLAYDKAPSEGNISGRSTASVIAGDVSEAMFRASFDRDMDALFRSSLGSRLYIARIDLINAGESAFIERIHNVPFGQYVVNGTLQNALFRSSLSRLYGGGGSETSAASGVKVSRASDREVSSGVCRVDLSSGSLKNKAYYSEEIVHGLGLGSVTVQLGLQGQYGATIYGNAEIFKEDALPVKLAAKLNPSKGSFIIGVMTTSTVLDDFIEVKWTAFRDVDEAENDSNEMKILIKPSSLVLKPRENRYLDAMCMNMANKALRWSVIPDTGGNIDGNGYYTAPVTEGVYEVVAESVAYPEVKASIMVVVRE